ncbi:MAG: NAD(P)-binding domain-containing protein, partial [Deltaproteobacteria bacterium]|nr:NAD(P)-binding domain-containing protein [Deltaproteobacteria bacterium]
MPFNRTIAIVGAGAWGTALAIHAARLGLTARLWARRPELAAALKPGLENSAFLPGFPLPPGVTATSDPQEAVAGVNLILWVIPSHGFREVVRRFRPYFGPDCIMISAAKGVED